MTLSLYTYHKTKSNSFHKNLLDLNDPPQINSPRTSIYATVQVGQQQLMLNNNRCKLAVDLLATAPPVALGATAPPPDITKRDCCKRTSVCATIIVAMTISRTDRWQHRFGALVQYANRTGTSLVPATQVEVYGGKNVALGAWVAYNRQQYRTGELSAIRRQALEQLVGWHWEKQKPGRRYDKTRDADIAKRYESGERVGDIAKSHNLSRQRVHQIVKKISKQNV